MVCYYTTVSYMAATLGYVRQVDVDEKFITL